MHVRMRACVRVRERQAICCVYLVYLVVMIAGVRLWRHPLVLGLSHPLPASIDVPFVPTGSLVGWVWDLSFCCTSCVIVSGAVAERVRYLGYCAFILFMSAIIYPFVAHCRGIGSNFSEW